PDHPTYAIDPEHDRARHYLTVLARLAPGVSMAQATAALQTVQARLAADHPDEERGVSAEIVPLRENLFGATRPLLFALLGVAAIALIAACGASLGLFGALQPLHVATALQEGGRTSIGGRRQARLRGAFLAAEVALSLVLLVGAGLLLRSFEKAASIDPGFDP